MTDAKKHPKIVVSGLQPSGRLHIGNHAGAVRNWLRLQKETDAELYFFIADYHSITEDYDPAEKRRQTREMAVELLACGIDPDRATLFVQSHVPEHTELCWVFNTVTPVSFLERMTQFKDKSSRQEKNVNMGLFDYPVLQAADILMYKGDAVPVGQDQVQHVELTRDIARFFNNKFEALFPETKAFLTDMPKVRSLTDPLKKMSKSLGDRSLIALADEPDAIEAKLKRAVTETTGILALTEDEVERRIGDLDGLDDAELRGQAGAWNLLRLLRLYGGEKEAETVIAAQPIKYGELKRALAARIADTFADFRKKKKELEKDPGEVDAMLAKGAEKARATAASTMEEVRRAIGVR